MTVYRIGKAKAAKVNALMKMVDAPENDHALDRYSKALVDYLREILTQREISVMRMYYGGADCKRIAAILCIDPGTVSRTCNRGLAKTRKVMKLAQEISPIKLPDKFDV